MCIFRLLSYGALFLSLVSARGLTAQDMPWSNLRHRQWLPATGDTLQDSLSIVTGSVWMVNREGRRVDGTAYRVDNDRLHWLAPPAADTLYLTYRVLPYNFGSPGFALDTSRLRSAAEGILISEYTPDDGEPLLPNSRELEYQGSFSRGLSFGNRQDLVLNSSFNLQMAGELGDGIEVRAAITDENLPIQPEGNTRQLREFDKVFIQIKRGGAQLTAGDYELRQPNGYFLRYFKKLEGATFSLEQPLGEGVESRSQASVAIARGQFVRQQIIPQEGNQGPYKLTGDGAQRFLIILAGTERVFLDGLLLERGREADYVIDYNQAEITFTYRRLITKDSRITVEYEYADQRYLRSLYAANTELKGERWQAYANVYSQQDSRTSTGDQRLTDVERELLRQAGDQAGGALAPAIDTLDGLGAQRATYALRDTLLRSACDTGGLLVQYLDYTTDPAAGRYVANFLYLGPGEGDYVLDNSSLANERIYRWVAPDSLTCQPRGEYAPVKQLAAPQLQRMFALGGAYRVGADGEIKGEVSISQEDLNRFSSLDQADDMGWAGWLDWRQRYRLGRDSNAWRLRTTLALEQVARHFKPINPYRSPEFLRDWNLATVLGVGNLEPAAERLGRVGLELEQPAWGGITYELSTFQREARYTGWRHAGEARLLREGWRAWVGGSWLDSEEPERRTRFLRPYAKLEKTFVRWGGWTLSAEANAERSERYATGEDELLSSSFFFERYSAALCSPSHEKRQLALAWRQRSDFLPQGSDFTFNNQAAEWEAAGHWQASNSLRLGGTFTYRSLAVRDTSLQGLRSGDTFLGRLDVGWNAWRNALRANTTYELGSGQEPKIEFTYLFVGPGQGQYIWLDSLYNNDGKIQPNEMEIAPYADLADYVRVSTFTNDFIRTDNLTLNQSLQIEPARLWRDAEGLRAFLARFDWQSSLTLNRKTSAAVGLPSWNPILTDLPDSALVAINLSQRHALFFNRRSARYDLQAEWTQQGRRFVQTTGFESQARSEASLRGRLNFGNSLSLRATLTATDRAADSEFFNNKDYQLSGYQWSPELIYQPGTDYRVSLTYRQRYEANELAGKENIRQGEIALEATFQNWLRAGVSNINVRLAGDPRSPVGFVLLNGLQPGRNWLWNAGFTRQLGKYLQLTLRYDGRQTGTAKTVHLGQAQVTALF